MKSVTSEMVKEWRRLATTLRRKTACPTSRIGKRERQRAQLKRLEDLIQTHSRTKEEKLPYFVK